MPIRDVNPQEKEIPRAIGDEVVIAQQTLQDMARSRIIKLADSDDAIRQKLPESTPRDLTKKRT
jgi:hypothetical protein